MKIYHMIIQNRKTGEREIYFHKTQGEHPLGWECIAVCGYHEKSNN